MIKMKDVFLLEDRKVSLELDFNDVALMKDVLKQSKDPMVKMLLTKLDSQVKATGGQTNAVDPHAATGIGQSPLKPGVPNAAAAKPGTLQPAPGQTRDAFHGQQLADIQKQIRMRNRRAGIKSEPGNGLPPETPAQKKASQDALAKMQDDYYSKAREEDQWDANMPAWDDPKHNLPSQTVNTAAGKALRKK